MVRGEQEVLSGLKPGETVIITGQSRLVDGSDVRVRDDTASAPTHPANLAPTNTPARKN